MKPISDLSSSTGIHPAKPSTKKEVKPGFFKAMPRSWTLGLGLLLAVVLVVLLVNNMLLTTVQQLVRVLSTVLKYNIRFIVIGLAIYWLYRKFWQKK